MRLMWLAAGTVAPWIALSGLAACGPSRNPAREAIDAAKAAEAREPGLGEARWGCPMHPDVRAEQPGDCPACGMPLVAGDPVKTGGS